MTGRGRPPPCTEAWAGHAARACRAGLAAARIAAAGRVPEAVFLEALAEARRAYDEARRLRPTHEQDNDEEDPP